MKELRRRACAAALACAVLVVLAPAAQAHRGSSVPELNWEPSGEAPNVTCADVQVPRDYDNPRGRTITLHLAKSPATDPANKIGSLFINFGGPGGRLRARHRALLRGLRP
jgi:hypothetical protein